MKEKILGTSTVTHNYRITLLNAIRPHIGNPEEGDSIVFVLKDGEVVIRKA